MGRFWVWKRVFAFSPRFACFERRGCLIAACRRPRKQRPPRRDRHAYEKTARASDGRFLGSPGRAELVRRNWCDAPVLGRASWVGLPKKSTTEPSIGFFDATKSRRADVACSALQLTSSPSLGRDVGAAAPPNGRSRSLAVMGGCSVGPGERPTTLRGADAACRDAKPRRNFSALPASATAATHSFPHPRSRFARSIPHPRR